MHTLTTIPDNWRGIKQKINALWKSCLIEAGKIVKGSDPHLDQPDKLIKEIKDLTTPLESIIEDLWENPNLIDEENLNGFFIPKMEHLYAATIGYKAAVMDDPLNKAINKAWKKYDDAQDNLKELIQDFKLRAYGEDDIVKLMQQIEALP